MKLDEYFRTTFAPSWLCACTVDVITRYQIAVDWFTLWAVESRLEPSLEQITEPNLAAFGTWLEETRRTTRNKSNVSSVDSYAMRLRHLRRFAIAKSQPARQDMRLADFVDVYVTERGLAPNSRKNYRYIARALSDHIGSDVMLGELSNSLIDEWVTEIPKKLRQHYQDTVGTLWHAAFELGYVTTSPTATSGESPEPIRTAGDNLRMICVSRYFPATLRIRDEKTRKQYRYALDDLAKYLGREPTLVDLTDDVVVGMMHHMIDTRKLAPKTVNERRGRINALWSWLAKRGYLKTWPTTGRISEPVRIPKAWTRDDLEKLFAAGDNERALIDGIPAPQWWRMLHVLAWVTGERISALLATRVEWVDFDRGSLVVQAEVRKGKSRDMRYRLPADVVDMLRSFSANPPRELLFPWPYNPSYLWARYKIIRKRAGLPTDPKSSFHRIRRSYASHLEVAGGDATAALGHSNRHVTQAYLDPSIVDSSPPELFKPWEKSKGTAP